MTLTELLKMIFGTKLDEEINLEGTSNSGTEDTTSTSTGGGDNTGAGDGGDPGTGTSENTDGAGDTGTDDNNGEDKEMPVTFGDGWFNRETMTFDLSKISDEATKAALQSVADAMKANNENLAIERAINDQIAKAGINVSNETFKKVLNTENIKVGTDGKVIGITEAFEALRKSEPSFFKEPSKESNPLNEGFSPVEKKGTLTEDEIINMAYGQE